MFVADSHCHLEALISMSNGYAQQVLIPSIKLDNAKSLFKYRNLNNNVKIGIGLHPWFIDTVKTPEELNDKLEELVNKYKPDFIGECGLDYYKPHIELQQKYLEIHMQIANKYNLPIILHCVKAYADLIHTLKKHQPKYGIVHAFNASLEIANELIKQNMILGIGSIITKPNNKLLNVINQIPLTKIVIESDAPFMPMFSEEISTPNATFLYAQIIATSRNINLIDYININNNNLIFWQ